MGERIGYVRISTATQHTERQENALADCDRIFTDVCSGKNAHRPELENMLAYVRNGDTVIVESFSRLARSLSDMLRIVEFLQKKGVALVSLKEQIDTTTPQGKLMLHLFAALSEFEREQTAQRQAEGIAVAKAADAARRAAGLPPEKFRGGTRIAVDPKEFDRQYKKWKAGEQTARDAMRNLKLKPNTFYRRVEEYEKKKGGR